jgi:hypothetical protein
MFDWPAILLSLIAMTACSSIRAVDGVARAGFDFSSVGRVAVVDVTCAQPLSAAWRIHIASSVEMELMRRGYDLVERSQLQQLLTEQRFQSSGLTDAADAVQRGRLLNVSAVVLVNVASADEEIEIHAKLLDVQSGTQLWFGSASGRRNDGMATYGLAALGAVAGAAAGRAIGDDGGSTLLGGAVGAVAGGAAGTTLEPQHGEFLKKVVAASCASLPSARSSRAPSPTVNATR